MKKAKVKNIEVKTTVEVTMEALENLVCSAMESSYGMSTYGEIAGYVKPKPQDLAKVSRDIRAYKHISYAIAGSGGVKIKDLEDGTVHLLTLKKLKKGLQLMAKNSPRHFADIFGDADAITGDVLVQYAIFGEHVYA